VEDTRSLTQELRALREALNTFRAMGKSSVWAIDCLFFWESNLNGWVISLN
jgi:hypothetical protein